GGHFTYLPPSITTHFFVFTSIINIIIIIIDNNFHTDMIIYIYIYVCVCVCGVFFAVELPLF
ncbi:hypothetical protein F5X96DRAFT_622515, partial [Biscogniauxia mediterranea]